MTAPRRVLLAGPRSFCAGVERAIEIVERALDQFGAPVFVRRQIVHNAHVVADLESRGAVFVEEVDDVPEGATVVLAAHGVAPEVRDDAVGRDLQVIDATCPLVAKVHHEARRFARQGYEIVLVGHSDHEEVVGTLGEAPDSMHVVASREELDALAFVEGTPVAYLTQTTLAIDETRDLVDRLRERFPDLAGPSADDICYATQNRQEALARDRARVRRRARHRIGELVELEPARRGRATRGLRGISRRRRARPRPRLARRRRHGRDHRRRVGSRVRSSTVWSTAVAAFGPVQVEERAVVTENVQFVLPPEVRSDARSGVTRPVEVR